MKSVFKCTCGYEFIFEVDTVKSIPSTIKCKQCKAVITTKREDER